MIIEEYDESLFISRFEDYKRVETPENLNGDFSYKGLRALFEYLDEAHDEENPLELDVVSLCCEFIEYKNIEEYLKDYSNEEEINEIIAKIKDSDGRSIKDIRESEEFKARIEEEINDKTTLIKFNDDLNEGFIIQQF